MDCLTKTKKLKSKHPAWTDPDDLDARQAEVGKDDDAVERSPKIADFSSDDDDDDDMYAGDVRSKKATLETKELQFKHLCDINNDRSYKGCVKQAQFNPSSKMALVSLSYGQADLFEIDGERNRYLQNLKLPRTKEPYCAFTPNGNSVIISSETYKGSFYIYDLVSTKIDEYKLRVGVDTRQMTDFASNDDYMACRKENSPDVHVLSTKTYENAFSIKLNEPAKSIQFKNDTNELFVAGANARVYIWDLRKTNTCKHRFLDEGSVHLTSLSICEKTRIVSIGSDSGVVNSYELDQCYANKFPTPYRTYYNLKSPVTTLKHNSQGELLLMASNADPGAFRLVHTVTGMVYKNFPVPNKKYGCLWAADFSPLSGYMALGCSSGRAHLCRIPYYKAY